MLIYDNYLFTGAVTEGECEENVLGGEMCIKDFHGDNSKVFTSWFLIILHTLSQWTDTFVLDICAIVWRQSLVSIRGSDEDVNSYLFIIGLYWLFCFMGTQQSLKHWEDTALQGYGIWLCKKLLTLLVTGMSLKIWAWRHLFSNFSRTHKMIWTHCFSKWESTLSKSFRIKWKWYPLITVNGVLRWIWWNHKP